MTTIIYIDTEQVLNVVHQLSQVMESVKQQIQNALSNASNMYWQGPSKDEFIVEFSQLTQQMNNLIEQGKNLGQKGQNEVAEWLGVDGGLAGTSGGASQNIQVPASPPAAPPPQPGPGSPPSSPPPSDSSNTNKIKNVISDMNVENNPKYRPRNGNTYCNIYAMDYAKKMGVPLPEYLDFNSDGKIDDYLDANEAVNWLRGTYTKGNVPTGPAQGWTSVNGSSAAELAQQGYVIVAGWENRGGIGHMAVVRPDSLPGNIRIAQAGAKNFSDGSLTDGFGTGKNIEFFVYKP